MNSTKVRVSEHILMDALFGAEFSHLNVVGVAVEHERGILTIEIQGDGIPEGQEFSSPVIHRETRFEPEICLS